MSEATMNGTETRSKIFINPVFKKAHINPNFFHEKKVPLELTTSPDNAVSVRHTPNIHFNPAFIERIQMQQQQEAGKGNMTLATTTTAVESNPIIKHTKRKLIRASSTIPSNFEKVPLPPLVKISKNKLVRSSVSTVTPANSNHGVTPRDAAKTFKANSSCSQLYKLDRRPAASGTVNKSKTSVRKYTIARTGLINPSKFVIKDRKLLKTRNIKASPKTTAVSKNKQQISGRFSLVNPHKSSYATNVPKSKERCLTIRGTTFLLDPSGNKLRKVSSVIDTEPKKAKYERVYVGGQPYVSKSDGTFERSKEEWYKTYLRWTKNKSINNLRNKTMKSNVPCPIFRRSGKCKNFTKGQCPKLHDPKHIIICPKFLKGECISTDCLLSHNVSFEKMPVCRFFLEGRCSKNDCLYLHKKVNEKERICEDFLNGYCPLADKCQNRHEFICPELDRNGVCEKNKCPYPHGRRNVQSKNKDPKSNPTDVTHEKESHFNQEKESGLREEASAPKARYFISNRDNSDEENELNNAQKARRTRLLQQVKKMKRNHLDENTCAESSSLGDQEETTNEEEIEIHSDSDCEDDDENAPFRKRVKLGPLPSFIPI